jgi:hypothetical protein
LEGLAYWNPTTDAYAHIDAAAALYPGQGYFVKVTDACNLAVRGIPFDYDSGRVGYEGNGVLKTGWNMIGPASKLTHFDYVTGTCVPRRSNTPAGILTSGPWGFNDDIDGDYYLTPFLDPGKAYWIQVEQDCSFNGKART